MNRRGFIGALIKGAVAVSIAAKIQAEWIPVAEVRRYVALEYLRKQFNDYCERQDGFHPPEAVIVGRELFDAARDEMETLQRADRIGYLFQRANDRREHLMFKGSKLIPEGRGYRIVRFEAAA